MTAPRVLVLQTGGTIDKDYPRSIGGYAFELSPDGVPASQVILERGRVDVNCVRHQTVCLKDSQDIGEVERQQILSICENSPESLIVITHGTDTILDTARVLSQSPKLSTTKRIVVTGAMLPETFKKSDADFTFGMAWASLMLDPTQPAVFVAVDGICAPMSKCSRNLQTGKFTTLC